MLNLQNRFSIPRTILAILHEIGSGTVKSFFPHPYSHLFCNHYKRLSFNSAASRLQKRGLITAKRSGLFCLTKKGEKEAFFSYLNAKVMVYKKKAEKIKWDGRWRIIFFDIPEKKKEKRNYLRSVIKVIGFKEFQKSVWVYPYKIPIFLTEILRNEKIWLHVRFITTQDIDYDLDIRELFSL